MRNPPPSRITTWMGHKEQGRIHFQNENYEEALASYRAALNPEYGCPTAERQILLSNIVACRLKMGGTVQASAAVEDAKQCVSLNESWAKGHVRLASAYIALGGHSNDACNSLQRALALDPGNAAARQMLMRELRRDRMPPPPSAPPEEQQDREEDVLIVEDEFSWKERLQFQYMRCLTWYQSQSDDVKTLLKVILALVVLYIAFGGRFGLDQLWGGRFKQNRGNYEAGNVYDRYHRRNAYSSDYSYDYNYGKRTQPRDYSSSSRYQDYSTHHGRPVDESSTYSRTRSFHFPNLFDGSIPSILCLLGIGYICHRNGINPFHAIWMLNMIGGNRGRGMHRMPMYGMGYGMMRNAFGNQRGGFRQPNMHRY